ncbi:MAG: hypothetical protein ACJ780_19340 [Solirubrobacteraceae bacterium]
MFIDPRAPCDDEQSLGLGRRTSPGRGIVVLTTPVPHRRSRAHVSRRYRATTSRAKYTLPAGAESIVLRGARGTMFWLPEHCAVAPAIESSGLQAAD